MVSQQTKQKVQKLIKEKPIFIAAKSFCSNSDQVKRTIEEITHTSTTEDDDQVYSINLDLVDDGQEIQDALTELTGQTTVPNVFIGGEHIGGNTDVQKLKALGVLDSKINAVLL
ncbi:conserved hypothetical protein [Lodderomyces elongisporus NRRL YB-4239]|uniref:Glutaredoxin domain-containing protein n=1 Tax=Lodderomyces elongisporus (strain ATCC 11503 / CBS 2605 / JCM 1781 / NBRC 1676 / NRRL YB-4239) TaxID=379508 RepID=A5DVU3_LODEL|nr:conserved hypothetical protein [Lodderomyces elongisporus NRRL YB-4239]